MSIGNSPKSQLRLVASLILKSVLVHCTWAQFFNNQINFNDFTIVSYLYNILRSPYRNENIRRSDLVLAITQCSKNEIILQ